MTEEINGVYDGPSDDAKTKRNGAKNGHNPRQAKNGADPLPGISLRELYAERNWMALGGLALIGVGALYLLGDLMGMSFSLWALSLLAIGGWLAYDGWHQYQAAGQQWVDNSRNRVLGGGVIMLVGLMGTLQLNWWGLLLLGVAGWLGYDTWQTVEQTGGEWSPRSRNRAWAAGAIGLVGLFGLVNLGSAWSWLLVIAGGIMIYRHMQGHRFC
ncbi:MAG: PrgI family protein [Anaerolineae bacterium]|nr:PrgI family protein [Anaerolineae bacterium]